MLKKLRLFITMLLACMLTAGCLAFAACGDGGETSDNGSSANSEEDTSSVGEWQDFTWTYADTTGASAQLECSLYVPASYKSGQPLPLVTYIPDSSYVLAVGSSVLTKTKKAACPTNWITDERVTANPMFYLIFGFTETSTSITTEGTQGAQIVPVINYVVEQYGMDTSRLYLTGQSMGGIADFAINDAYKDMFAATVYVGCQPGAEVEDDQYNTLIESAAFASQKFVYIASRKDEKAPYGQDAVQAKLDELNVDYKLLYGLDHTDSAALNTAIEAVLDEGCDRNFFGFTQLTDNGNGSAEHMQSFKYAYAVDSIYEWLIEQTL